LYRIREFGGRGRQIPAAITLFAVNFFFKVCCFKGILMLKKVNAGAPAAGLGWWMAVDFSTIL
jgi:hypothetical protein